MKQESSARIPSQGCSVVCCALLCFLLLVSVTHVEGVQQFLGYNDDDGCAGYGRFQMIDEVRGGLEDRFSVVDACNDDSESFCFSSTLVGSTSGESRHDRRGLEVFDRDRFVEVDEMENEKIFPCSLVASVSEVVDGVEAENGNFHGYSFGSCKRSNASDIWMKRLNGLIGSFDESYVDGEESFLDGSLSPQVDISPSSLDWGMGNMFILSLQYLTVTNRHNESVLYVYEPFSTDPQFYPCDFRKFCLAPGETVSIGFVFLPRWLGSSIAHVVLQTSFGGFVIHAKGIAVESPYRTETFVGLAISSGFKFNWNLSLHNPFDDVLYVEVISTRISFSYGDKTDSRCIACSKGALAKSTGNISSSANVKDSFTSKNNVIRIPWLEIKPHREWEVSPQEDGAIAELKLWPQMQGKFFGIICMKLRNFLHDKSDVVIIPLEGEVHDKATYGVSTGLVSASVALILPCEGAGSIFVLSIRNGAENLLSVASISEVTEGSKLLHIKYTRGLIIYPGTVTKVALIGFTPSGLQDLSSKIPGINFMCKLSILTNDSASLDIEIPCQDLLNACSRHELELRFVPSDGSYVRSGFQEGEAKLANAKSGVFESIGEESQAAKSKQLKLLEAEDLILNNWRSQGSMNELSVLKDHGLLFPIVQIGTHFSKWIMVHNPSPEPVVMQILLSSGAIIDQCKFPVETYKDSFNELISPDSTVTRYGFFFANSAVTEAFMHPLESALLGPIVFHLLSQCTWRSSALIRNNLSGVEWLPLQAFGGLHSLVLLDGSEPLRKLEFSFDLSIDQNSSSLDTGYNSNAKTDSCSHVLSKELQAKNTGELPLEVIKLEVSGTDCGLDGFRVEACKTFSLAPGDSKSLIITYEADFSTTEIHRDLKLAMTTGYIVIPMKASIPVFMLKDCRKSFWKLTSKPIFVMLAVAPIFLLLLSILPLAFPSVIEDYQVKDDNAISTIMCDRKPAHVCHFAGKKSSVKANVKNEVAYANGYAHFQNGVQGNFERTQGKKELDYEKKTALMQSSSVTMHSTLLDSSDTSPLNGHLTVRVARERGRRRKKRLAGGGLAAKFEVSSSQSANSTPSSPLSPSALTPNEIWPFSPDTPKNPFSGVSLEMNGKKKEFVPEPEIFTKCSEHSHFQSHPEQLNATAKATGRPMLFTSATFPSAGWHAPGVATRTFLASTSPIAPHARAPGSNLNKEKTTMEVKDDVLRSKFTYDIWGNYFSHHLVGRPKGVLNSSDAWEGDSQSFFARDPQSLMMMPSEYCKSPGVSPDKELPLNDVKCLNPME